MTNFEWWKDKLKPKELIIPRIIDGTKCVYISCEMNCPAENCPAKKAILQRRPNWERWKKFVMKCDKWWLRWAKAEHKFPRVCKYECELCKNVVWIGGEWSPKKPVPTCENPKCNKNPMRFCAEMIDR